MQHKGIHIYNARILTPEGWIENGSLCSKDGLITRITGSAWVRTGESEEYEQVDARGGMLLPGFIDLHVHGGGGYDAMLATEDQLQGMCRFHAAHGTTSLLATTLTAAHDEIIQSLECAGQFIHPERSPDGANLLGIHLEGPFLNPARCGAQNPEDLREPSIEEFEAFWAASQGSIKLMTIAPELGHAEEVIRHAVCRGVVVSLGHTDADFAVMQSAVEWGASQVTHLFNGMKPLHHREPGAAGGALILDPLAVEVICDGVHVHPDLMKWIFRAKPEGKVLLITDSMCAAGCLAGEYVLGKLPVRMRQGKVYLKQEDRTEGSLAGSSLTMIEALANAVRFTGMDIADIVPALTVHPAVQIGAAAAKGTIEPGKDADLVLVNEQFKVLRTFVRGRQVYACEEELQ
ncbi:N-acetylglucosamine-6-phosphate deacetylase [Paenibacillus sp. MMS20-IR301]|uniref:N-acetylglucosamine-6-phosphate deacetylase n=1 Tax=Paenibacillus sp. MMS20-IR301 TaxID=2895946 RepID=UPI0028EBE5D2|nr:N-acetylglucosamine-6-phosphate deacetylase [Paenibacillus sp. MMS20-IR301]WNS43938.1 N-acetylglucosamine-6-phosphate deacetylase [Paenibacillus sp. MMS20-IR301]